MESNNSDRVTRLLQKIIEKLTPSVVEAIENNSSGHFEIHFDKGEYRRAKKNVTIK